MQPEHAEAQYNLAHILGAQGYAHQERGEPELAIENYLEALSLAPGMARVHNNLGNAYNSAGRPQQAVAAFREAIDLEPGLAEAHLNLAMALQQSGEDETQAAAHYRRAAEISPNLAEAQLNLGVLLEKEGDPAGAKECYARAVTARRDFAEAHFNYALQLLLAGDFARGWEEYEWRMRLPDLARYWPYPDRPRWEGSPLDGKVILLYAEQGFGDAIQFVRYAPLVAARGGRVIAICQPKLKALFEGAPGLSAAYNAGEPDPEFDVCCSLLSLPRLFGTTLQTIPARVPYLNADREKYLHWKARLAQGDRAMRVGLVWASQSSNATARSRSLDLDLFAPLAGIRGVEFYSLQKGPGAEQAARPPQGMQLRDCGGALEDFSDTAALISNLDLVISIDTAVAHLAGALAKPVWTMTNWPPEWRWLLGRDDSPWYPTMCLFRRCRTEQWEQVIGRVAETLRERAANR